MQNQNDQQKIISILEGKKQEEPKQPDLDEILTNVQSIPEGVLSDYFLMIDDYIADLLAIKQTFSARNNSLLFRHICENLTESQVERLQYISADLNSKELLSRLREIAKMTFGAAKATPDSHSKACEFLKKIKSLNINFAAQSKEYAGLSYHFQTLSEIFWLLDVDKEAFTDMLATRLAENDDGNLDYIIGLANTSLPVEKNTSN